MWCIPLGLSRRLHSSRSTHSTGNSVRCRRSRRSHFDHPPRSGHSPANRYTAHRWSSAVRPSLAGTVERLILDINTMPFSKKAWTKSMAKMEFVFTSCERCARMDGHRFRLQVYGCAGLTHVFRRVLLVAREPFHSSGVYEVRRHGMHDPLFLATFHKCRAPKHGRCCYRSRCRYRNNVIRCGA